MLAHDALLRAKNFSAVAAEQFFSLYDHTLSREFFDTVPKTNLLNVCADSLCAALSLLRFPVIAGTTLVQEIFARGGAAPDNVFVTAAGESSESSPLESEPSTRR